MIDELPVIVVGRLELGESDRVIRLLSATQGRLSVLARRARSSPKKYGGAFELGNALRVTAAGRGELLVVKRVEVDRTPLRARESLDRIAHLAWGCEVAAGFSPEGAPSEKLFGLLEAWLAVLEGDPAPGVTLRSAFAAKALTFAGVAPRFVRCARCDQPLTGDVVWSDEAGGGLHDGCGEGQPVPLALLTRYEALRRLPLSELQASAPAPLPELLRASVEHHLGHRLASQGLLSLI